MQSLHYIYMYTICFLILLYLNYIVLLQDYLLVAALLLILLAVLGNCCQVCFSSAVFVKDYAI